MAMQSCSITATNFTTPHDVIFPHKPGIIMVPEDAKRGTELDYVIARKNPLFPKHVYLELWGSPLFAIRQKIVPPEMTEGTIFLLGPLDFEKQSMYHLTILANDPYAEPGQDSRNIAGLEIVIIVEDVQDVPPIFTMAPPVTRLPNGLLPGDKLRDHQHSHSNLIHKRDDYMDDTIHDQDYERMSDRLQNQIDDDSMRRHEMDRGSDIAYNMRETLRHPMTREDDPREQFFIKDGNAEILRLVTRGKANAENIYMNLPQRQMDTQHPQYIVVDNGGGGKEILMRRYIEEQANGKQIIREHYQVVPEPSFVQSIPNEVVQQQVPRQMAHVQMREQDGGSVQLEKEDQMIHATSHHSLIQQELENSLKQQNALLRQILLEKEKLEARYNQQEAVLETQSLPCNSMNIATQTDVNAGTQTEPEFQKTRERRRTRSENDDSMSDDDYEYVRYSPPDSPHGVYWMKRKCHKKRSKTRSDVDNRHRRVIMVSAVKRKIRTPIQEEKEESNSPQQSEDNRSSKQYKNKSVVVSPLNKSLLVEITESLDEKKIVPKVQQRMKKYSSSKSPLKKEPNIKSEAESSDNEIVVHHYSAESLDEKSDVEEVEIKCSRRRDPRNIVFSRRESLTDINKDLALIDALETEIARKARRQVSSQQSASDPNDSTRLSRSEHKKTKGTSQQRRQTASEPPQSRSTKGPAPKPPDQKRNQKKTSTEGSKTLSETDMLKRINDEAIDISKPQSKYMDWYYNLDKDDSVRSDKSRGKAVVKKTAPGIDKAKKKTSPLSARSDKILDTSTKQDLSQRKDPRMLKEDIQKARNLQQKNQDDGNHPLLQHSEHRFEHEYIPTPSISAPPTQLGHYLYPQTPPQVAQKSQKKSSKDYKNQSSPIRESEVKDTKYKPYNVDESKQLNVATLEDDHDSGIAMNSFLNSMGRKNPITDKKSVFTIAYDEVKVSKLRSESESSPVS
uniref:Uncharacterized protein n=1 Tax=Phlebotomus papatasi TaxID=29031 RepID=A0A1B0GM05_PHLPP